MSTFNKNKYRKIVADCFDADPAIFWRDFMIAYVLFLGFSAVLLFTDLFALRAFGFVGAALMAYRCASYIHEIVHLPRSRFASFIKGWNIMIGVPFLMPSVLYESHLDHHLPRKYATKDDPEYLVLAGCSFATLIGFIAHHAFVTPLILYVRMLIGLPVRLVSAKASDYLDRRFSSLVINWQYDRRNKSKKSHLMALEAYVLSVTVIGNILVFSGLLDPLYIALMVSVIVFSLILNAIRTLAAHRYANGDLQAVSSEEQLLDSLNYGGPRWCGLLMAPVGLRYHALHHLFPSMPYHTLETAHNRLMAELEDGDVYKKTVFKSFWKQMSNLMQSRPDTITGAVEPRAAE